MKKFLALIFLCVAVLYSSQAEAVIRIGAYQFWVSSGNSITYNWVNDKYEKLFSDMLSKTELFELVPVKRILKIEDALIKSGREPNGWKSMSEAGRIEKCRYIFTGQMKLEKDLSSAAIDFQLIDLLTDETIPIKDSVSLQLSPVSTSSETGRNSRGRKSSSKQKQSKTDTAAVKEQVITQAFGQVVERLLEDIAGNSPIVAGIKGSSVLLNRGNASGLKPGDLFRVYAETSDGTEDIFGTDYTETIKTNVALVQVKEVADNSSTAEIFQDAGSINNIHIGDKIAAVANSEVQGIIAEIASASSQPSPDTHTSGLKTAVNAPSSPSVAVSLPPLAPGTIRIGIVKFDNKADNVLDKEAGAITDLCTRFLSVSDKIAVIEKDKLDVIAREHRLNLSGLVDASTAAQLGKLAGCQYILTGSITNMGESQSASSNYIDPNKFSGKARDIVLGLGVLQVLIGGGITEKEERNMSVTIDARIVNVETSEIEFALQETGRAKQVSAAREKGFKYSKTVTRGGIQSQAVDYAAANLGLDVTAKLTGEYPKVSAVNGHEIIVDRGSSSGVHTGDLLCTAGAVLSVKEVQPDFSVAELVFAANRRPNAGELIIPCLYNDFHKDVLISAIKKADKTSDASSRKSSNASSAKAKARPAAFDKSKFELSSTDAKKVIMSYGLSRKEEKKLLDAHSKASKMSSTRKKYEAYVKLAQSTLYDYLASYNAAKYALELSMLKEAGEWADKALLINPEYEPAKTLMSKIEKSR